ncbi:MAG: glycosyltransferase family 39 protein [Bacteroidales bacterium]|jgi:hypothetical protein|nr:glycosyltransferase family 39 protein [Bacteroidales bacterium]
MKKQYWQDKYKTLLSLGIILILGFLYLAVLFPDVLFHTNQWLAINVGDGLKNYYTYQNSIHSETFTNFQGFNYPQGECFFFLDSHPALSAIFHGINKVFPGFDGYTIGILNMLFLVNLVITWILLYLVLKRYVKSEWYVVLTSFAIMLLQPQIFRLAGHLSLSFSMAIPLTWYLLIKFWENKNKIYWGIILILSNFFWIFTHAYLGAMTMAFAAIYGLTWLIIYRKELKCYTWLSFLLVVILPGIISMLITSFFDIHEGRIIDRPGLGFYSASFSTIFVPIYYSYLHDILVDLIPSLHQNWEGWAYVGLFGSISTLVTIRYLFLICKRKVSQKRTLTVQHEGLYHSFMPALVSSVCLLFYAMNTDVDGKWILWIADQFHFLKNFRSTGRFSWAFYYVITVFGASFFYTYIQGKAIKHKIIRNLLLCIIPLSLILEAIPYQKFARTELFKIKNPFIYENLSLDMQKALKELEPDVYQAILPLPYYFMSSDNYEMITSNDEAESLTQLTAYYTQLPLISSHTSHIAIPDAKKHMQLVNMPYYDKEIKDDFPNKKPFLIFHYKNLPLNPWDEYYFSQSTLICDYETFSIRSIDFDKMLERNDDEIDKLINIVDSKSYTSENLSLNATGIIRNNCDDYYCTITKYGSGAISLFKTNEQNFWTVQPDILQAETPYELSFWAYNCGRNYGEYMTTSWRVKIYEITENGKVELGSINAKNSPYIVGCWSLCQLNFTPQNTHHELEIVCYNDNKTDTLYFDEFLLRPINQNVIEWIPSQTKNKTLYYNNHFIDKDL